MVIRVATFDSKPASHDNPALMTAFRDWTKSQPGFRAAWHASESKTGKALSISVWDDLPSLMAMKDRKFPGGSMDTHPSKVEIFDDVDGF